MTWVAIADSGIAFNFSDSGGMGYVTMSGSVVTAQPPEGQWGGFEITTEAAQRFRYTFQAFRSESPGFGEAPSQFEYYPDGSPDPLYIVNGNGDTIAESFIPNPVEAPSSYSVTYQTGQGSETSRWDTYQLLVEVWEGCPSYNCECDDDYPRTTLAAMRKRLLRRLGFSAQADNPPPGMADLLDDFIRSAQELLFHRYSVFRRERFFTWDMVAGQRFYDLDVNADECTKRLEPRMISWAGISRCDGDWKPLYCGIDPVMYTSRGPGIPSHFEIRQCIEVWPAPVDGWKLRIKGQFGLMPLEVDADFTTVEPEAIFLLALANAKAHYGQPDAGNYASQLKSYVADLIRGGHHTRRYIPGTSDPRNAVRPVPVGGWPEDQA